MYDSMLKNIMFQQRIIIKSVKRQDPYSKSDSNNQFTIRLVVLLPKLLLSYKSYTSNKCKLENEHTYVTISRVG